MLKKHIITIAGNLGSGKSSTAKMVSEILGYKHSSTGDFMRSIASDRGVSLMELSKIAENDPSVDISLDDHNREVGKEENVVLDSRLGFHFVPESFKVFLKLDSTIAAQRILNDKSNNPNRRKEDISNFDTVENISRSILERLISEKKRYKDLYEIADHTSSDNFDLVIDTSTLPLEEVSNKVVEEYNNWLNK